MTLRLSRQSEVHVRRHRSDALQYCASREIGDIPGFLRGWKASIADVCAGKRRMLGQFVRCHAAMQAFATIEQMATLVGNRHFASPHHGKTHPAMKRTFLATMAVAILPFAASAQTVSPGASYPYPNYLQLTAGITGTNVVTSGGAGQVTGDSVTFATTGGICTVAPVGTVTAAAGVASAVSITTPGVCSQPPLSPLAQASTTGSGTGLTITPAQLAWGGTWTAAASQVLVQIVAGGGGSGAVSGAGAATTTGASSGQWADVLMTLTPGASISYSLGQGGLAGASGGANSGGNGSATVFNGLSLAGGKLSAGQATGQATLLTAQLSVPGAAPTASQHIIASGVQPGQIGTSGTGGAGGGTPAGSGGVGTNNAAGNQGTGYGAGASGTGDTGSVTHAGAAGTGGGIWVRW